MIRAELNNKNVLKVILHIPYARTIRELARITKLPPTTVQNILLRLRKIGKIKFIPDDAYFGLIRIAIIVKQIAPLSIEKLPKGIGVVAIREFLGIGFKAYVIYGLVPYKLKEQYIQKIRQNIDGEIVAVVEAKEFLSWKPDEDFIVFIDYKRPMPIMDKIFSILEEEKAPPQYNCNSRVPDEIDLKILVGKLAWGPYIRPYSILKRINIQEGKPIPPKQTISYHYRNHVLKGWKYNTFHYYLPMAKVPFTALYLKGPEAPALARALLALPGSFFAYVDVNQSYIFAQYACSILHDIFNLTSTANVEAPLGTITMKLALKTKSPKLWRFLYKVGRRYEWRWPVEALVESRN